MAASLVAAACGSDDTDSASNETTAPVETVAPAETTAPVETDAPVETESPADTTAETTAETDAPVEAEGPFRVLFIGPMSGPLAVIGASETAGLNAAIDEVNANGGILGHQVELTLLDDAGDGTTAISVLEEEMSSGTEYHLIIPGAGAADGLALAPVLADVPVLQIVFGGETKLNNPDEYPNLFVPSGGFGPQTLGVMTKVKDEGYSRVAILYGDNVAEGADFLGAAAEEVGVEVVAKVGVPAAATDATSQLQQAMDGNPEAIAISGFSPALVPILKARTTLGLDIPVYLDPFAGAANLGPSTTVEDRAGVFVETFPFLAAGDPSQDDPVWQAFATGVEKYLPEPLISLYAPLIAWDAIMMARAAAEAAGTISGDTVPKALAQIGNAADVEGFLGGSELYSPEDHMWQLKPSDYAWYPAGPLVGGLLVPDE